MLNSVVETDTAHFKERIQGLLKDPHLRTRVLNELQSQGISPNSPLEFQITTLQNQPYLLEQNDVYQVFSVYGPILNFEVSSTKALIAFQDIVSAYFAKLTLDQRSIQNSNLTLNLKWLIIPSIPPSSSQWTKSASYLDCFSKYTCRYQIQIPNEKEFQVARRLIGCKGVNMKNILEMCSQGLTGPRHDVLKLRLRGKGSGFKQGPAQEESQDPLHLCVSSKYFQIFQLACQQIESLLSEIYRIYREFNVKKGIFEPELKIRKFEDKPALGDITNYSYF